MMQGNFDDMQDSPGRQHGCARAGVAGRDNVDRCGAARSAVERHVPAIYAALAVINRATATWRLRGTTWTTKMIDRRPAHSTRERLGLTWVVPATATSPRARLLGQHVPLREAADLAEMADAIANPAGASKG